MKELIYLVDENDVIVGECDRRDVNDETELQHDLSQHPKKYISSMHLSLEMLEKTKEKI